MYELHLFVLAVQKCLTWLPALFVVAGASVLAVFAFLYTNKQLAGDLSRQAGPAAHQSWHQSHRVRDFVIGLAGMCAIAAAAH